MGMESFGGDEEVALEGAERIEDKDKAEAMATASDYHRTEEAQMKKLSEEGKTKGMYLESVAKFAPLSAEYAEEKAAAEFDAQKENKSADLTEIDKKLDKKWNEARNEMGLPSQN